MLVRDLMTRDPVSVEPETPIAEAARILHTLDIRHLPVMDDGELVGILSDKDIAAFTLPDVRAGEVPGNVTRHGEATVHIVMSGGVISTGPEAGIGEAVDLMVEYRLGALPVVDEESCELVGMLSYIDVLRHVREELELL